ncbi:MAG: radical SAM protein [bacterium]|nr:radical SAM protein [bacterium]
MIKPSHYDDDGYVLQWARSAIPSNSLAALHGLALDCVERRVLGEDVEIVVSSHDESNRRIKPSRIAREIAREGGRALVALVGVQTNQFPRAVDLGRQFRAEGLPVVIGGFHVSGSLAMLPDVQSELQQAMDDGLSLFAGEAEHRFEQLLQDAYAGALKPLYDYMNDLPALVGSPTPYLPVETIQRTAGSRTSFDAGRGCPFQCSFCTIINVQGRKSRRRGPDDVEKIVRENLAQGVKNFFITDDNFARNAGWEPIFDRLIALREDEGLPISFIVQVDTLCHRIPNFIEKAGRAGVKRVFIGMESINPAALKAAGKRQNRISEYRSMLQAWHGVGAITYAGYIVGFPGDTPESIVRDVKIIQRELPIDLLEFFLLTPLPGSEDHQKLHQRGVWMDPDLNKYDVHHVTTAHPQMSKQEWNSAYRLAWETFYSPEHVETLMRRAAATRGGGAKKIQNLALWFYGSIAFENVHPLESGLFRRKHRRDRRPSLPLESPFVFYPRFIWESAAKYGRFLGLLWAYTRRRRKVERDPAAGAYRDLALAPAEHDHPEELELLRVAP